MLIIWNALMKASEEKAAKGPGDLVLNSGEFTATHHGVVVRLKPPLNRLSGHYPWSLVPIGIAALRALISGEDHNACHATVARFKLSMDETDQLEKRVNFFIGSDTAQEEFSELRDDVDRLMEWGASLAPRCPSRAAAERLAMLPKMSDQEVGRYVTSVLG